MTGIAVLPYCVWACVCALLHRNINAYPRHFTISEIRLFLPKKKPLKSMVIFVGIFLPILFFHLVYTLYSDD